MLQVKGYSQSTLGSLRMPANLLALYERVWDEADYVVPPAENAAFFVTTNVVITPNQTLGHCPEVSTCISAIVGFLSSIRSFLHWEFELLTFA